MKNNGKYSFLEWVFDDVGLGKFILYLYIICFLAAASVLTFVWWYTKR